MLSPPPIESTFTGEASTASATAAGRRGTGHRVSPRCTAGETGRNGPGRLRRGQVWYGGPLMRPVIFIAALSCATAARAQSPGPAEVEAVEAPVPAAAPDPVEPPAPAEAEAVRPEPAVPAKKPVKK